MSPTHHVQLSSSFVFCFWVVAAVLFLSFYLYIGYTQSFWEIPVLPSLKRSSTNKLFKKKILLKSCREIRRGLMHACWPNLLFSSAYCPLVPLLRFNPRRKRIGISCHLTLENYWISFVYIIKCIILLYISMCISLLLYQSF